MLVSPLPEGNYLLNPWFHGENLQASFEHWQPDQYWNLAVPGLKNPSPDSPKGTAAKMGPVQFQGQGLPGVPAFLYQIFPGNPEVTTLYFQAWVEMRPNNYVIGRLYGGDTEIGPFTAVWMPLMVNQDTGPYKLFGANTVIPFYAFYKFELEAQFADGLGCKVTGGYLGPNT